MLRRIGGGTWGKTRGGGRSGLDGDEGEFGLKFSGVAVGGTKLFLGGGRAAGSGRSSWGGGARGVGRLARSGLGGRGSGEIVGHWAKTRALRAELTCALALINLLLAIADSKGSGFVFTKLFSNGEATSFN